MIYAKIALIRVNCPVLIHPGNGQIHLGNGQIHLGNGHDTPLYRFVQVMYLFPSPKASREFVVALCDVMIALF